MLLWDINAEDPKLRRWNKYRFGSLKRLPLFYFWRCSGDLSYEIVGEGKVRVFGSTGKKGRGALYEGYPRYFARQPIELSTDVPAEVRRAIGKWGPDSIWPSKALKKADLALLVEFFGHPVDAMMSMFHHQFGGVPLLPAWDDEAFVCPNPKCRGSVLDRALGKRHSMKFLAGVLNDPPSGLPMVEPFDEQAENWNYWVSVQFHMCDCCLFDYGS
jgi:hypothetical protein